MSTQLSQEIIDARNRLVDEHVQAEVDHDIERIMATWGEKPWFDDVGWEERSYGREEIRAHYVELLNSFPDLDIEVHKRHVTDEFVILEVTVTGTHLGDWRDLPALGRKMSSRVCALYSFDSEGMLELERTYFDKAIILEQLGIYQDPRTTLGKVLAVLTPPFTIVKAFLRKVKGRARR